jgi:hypothetical protein
METGQYIKILAEFVTGEINFSEFKQAIEERLFELRQEPEMTNEKKLLSSVELRLHEAEEGLRPEFEVYAHVQSILDNIILHFLTTSEGITQREASVFPKIPYSPLSKTFDIDPERSETEEAVRALSTAAPM